MQTLFTQYKHKTEGLNRLAEQVEQREQLLVTLRACLNSSMQQALLSAEILDDTLILITPSAAWATRLRFEAQKLLAAANHPNLRQYRIQVITNHKELPTTQQNRSAEKPSDEAIVALQEITNNLAANDTLKASMMRLLRLISKETSVQS
jgi:hypothetical protein